MALGERSRSLHEHCAPVWFRAASEPETTCAHCGIAGGARPGQTWTIGGRDVWLHVHCEGPFHDAHANDPPPWEPPEPPDQGAPPW